MHKLAATFLEQDSETGNPANSTFREDAIEKGAPFWSRVSSVRLESRNKCGGDAVEKCGERTMNTWKHMGLSGVPSRPYRNVALGLDLQNFRCRSSQNH